MTAQAPAESLSVSLGLIIHNNWDWYYAWDQIQQVPCTGVPPVQGFETRAMSRVSLYADAEWS